MSGKIENFGAFDKNAEIARNYFIDGKVSVGDLPPREAIRMIQNETNAVESYTVQLTNFINGDGLGICELVYVLVAMARVLKMMKRAIRDLDPDLYDRYKKTCEMCDHSMNPEAVIALREKGEKNE